MRKSGVRRSHADGGSAWISYSDMMAALILLFVLVLSYTMYQYYSMLETKTAELDEQAILLAEQGATLASQKEELSSKQILLLQQQNELDETKTSLAEKEVLLSAQQQTLTEQEAVLLSTRAQLAEKEDELSKKETALSAATAQLDEQQQLMKAQQVKLDQLVGVRTQIVRDLTNALQQSRINADVDRNTGDIVLESSVFFDVGKSSIREEGQSFLNTFIPIYLNVLLKEEYNDYLGEIIIEGHTDTSGTYLKNLELSQNRALSVAKYCLEMHSLTSEQRKKLQSILTAKGRSWSDPIYSEDGVEDMDASRRVEFKFRLKDSEMIDEIRDILGES